MLIFKFSLEVRKVIYTTNTIESLSSTYKKLNRQRTVYPSDKAIIKYCIYHQWKQQRNGINH